MAINERLQLDITSPSPEIVYLNKSTTVDEKYDETLDSCKVSFLSSSAMYDRFTKCRLLMESGTPSYNSDGKPFNHIEFVIESGDLLVHTDQTKHDYTLIEPTYVLKYIRMESLTFTSRSSITIKEGASEVTYDKDPYNLYTMIQRIFRVTRIHTSAEDNSLNAKIRIMDAQLLQNQAVNIDDEFKENTVYDALVKIGRYINRVPVLYFSRDDDYEYDLWFERKDGLGSSASVNYSTFISGNAGLVKSLAADLGANTVVSDVDNMVTNELTQGVSQDWGIRPRFDDTTFIISTNDTQCFIQVKNGIKEMYWVNDVTAGADGIGGWVIDEELIRCLPYEQWLGDDDKTNIAYFKENDDKIYFGDTKNAAIVADMRTGAAYHFYNVKYFSILDAKTVATKNGTITYETTYNQVDSYVDAGVYGISLRDYIKTHGNAEITVKRLNNDYLSMYAIGTRVIDGSDSYVITSRSFSTYADLIAVVYQLNKGAVKRADFVRASERIREHGIDYGNTQIRYTNIHEPIGLDFTTSVAAYAGQSTKYLTVKNSLFYNFFSTSDKQTYRNELPQQVYMRSKSTLLKDFVSTDLYEYYLAGFTSTRLGNSILLNIRFNDNKIAGYKVTTGNPITQSPVYYADPFAEIQTLQFGIGKYKDMSINQYLKSGAITADETDNIHLFADNYPDLSSSDFTTYYNSSAIKVADFDYLKDGREIGNLTYQIEFISRNGSIIYPDMGDACGYLPRKSFANTYVIVCNVGVNLGENDIITTSRISSIHNVSSVNVSNRDKYLQFTTSSSLAVNNRAVALCVLSSTGVYKPLIAKNAVTFADTNIFYLTY